MSGAQPQQGHMFGVEFTFLSLLFPFFFFLNFKFVLFLKKNVSSVPSHVGTRQRLGGGPWPKGGAPAGTPPGPCRVSLAKATVSLDNQRSSQDRNAGKPPSESHMTGEILPLT